MFERKFKAIILKILGEFVEDFDDSELQVDNWSGHVTQTRLNIKPNGLRFLSRLIGIDIIVVRGVIGSLQLSFNWRALWREPIRLTLEDLYVVCKPQNPPDPTFFQDKRRRAKRSRLEDLVQKKKFQNPNKTYLQKLEATVSDNICISLKNVHLRYEDTISNPFRPFVIGLTLDKLVYSPSDSNWVKNFITLELKKQAQKSFMVLELGQFAFYHISKSSELFSLKADWLKTLSNEKFAGIMFPFIAHRDYVPQISEYYLLKPVNAEIRIRRSLKPPAESDIPKLSVSIIVEEIACALEANQYQDLLMLGSFISLHKVLGHHIVNRPLVRPKSKPRDWWIYALNMVSEKVKKKIVPCTWDYFKFRKENKQKYINIYQLTLVREYESETGRVFPNFTKTPQLNSKNKKELDIMMLEIEDHHNVEEILLFRYMAERELSSLKDSKKKKGWIEWGKGWFVTSTSADEEAFLNTLVEYSEMMSQDAAAPSDFVKYFVNFELRRCSISLAARQVNGLQASFLKITLDEGIIHRQKTKTLTETFLALSSLRIVDPFTPIGKFRKLFNPKNVDESFFFHEPGFEVEEEIFPEENDGFPQFAKHELKVVPLFQLMLNADTSETMSLKVNIQPLEVIYNKQCVERINGFLKIPEALALFEAIEMQTMNQLANWKLKTQARIEYIIKNHLKLETDIRVSAPVIIIPQNPLNEESSQVILNLGNFNVISKPRELSYDQLMNRKNSDVDENAYYDHFDVTVSDISVMLLPPEGRGTWTLVDKFDFIMHVSKSIIPKDPHLTTIKIQGEISELTAKISRIQYMLLQQYKDADTISSVSGSFMDDINYKLPEPILDDEEDDEEFFDAEDPYEDLVAENVKFPYNKEHFNVEFGVKRMNFILLEDKEIEEEEKSLLTFTAKDLLAGASIEESRRRFCVRLGGITVQDWIESRLLVSSNQERSDLIVVELTKILETHPDYALSKISTFLTANLSHLYINYFDEPVRIVLGLLKKKSAPSFPKISPSLNILAKVSLENVSLKLNDTARELTELHLSYADFHYTSSEVLRCKLGRLTIKDCLNSCFFFETKNKDLLELELLIEEEERTLGIKLKSFKLIMVMDMIEGLISFVLSSELFSYMKKIKKAKEIKKPRTYSYNAEVIHPQLEFLDPQSSQGSCVIDFGEINTNKNAGDELTFNIQGSQIFTIREDEEGEVYQNFLIKDFEMSLESFLPEVNLKIRKIIGSSSASQISFLLQLYSNYKSHLKDIGQMLHLSIPKKKEEKKEIKSDVNLEAENVAYSFAHGLKLKPQEFRLKVHAEIDVVELAWWTLFHHKEDNVESACLSLSLSQVLLDYNKKIGSNWLKFATKSLKTAFKIDAFGLNQLILLQQESLTQENALTLGFQILPDSYIIDLDILSPRIILSPCILKGLLLISSELSLLLPKSKKKTPIILSGQMQNFQLLVTTDSINGPQDEEDKLDPMKDQEYEEKRYTILQMSVEFQDNNINVNDCCVLIGSSAVAVYGAEISGKPLLHPLQIRYRGKDSKALLISDIGIDLSLSQSVYFQEMMKQFSSIIPKREKQVKPTKIDLKIEIQQILLSISHDFTISKHSANTYFMLRLDSPYILLSSTDTPLAFSTGFAFYYYNQQLFDWEPFIENFRFGIEYNTQGGQKKIQVTSQGDFNVNVSYSFITTFSNFLKGFEQKDYFTHLGLLAKSKMQIKWGSGYSIKNETGQQIKCWIDNRLIIIQHNEEHALHFEERDEVEGSAVTMFKHKLKKQRGYRIKSVSIQIGELPRLNDICIDRIGCKIYNIAQLGAHFHVLCDVLSRHGDKLLVIRSPIQLKNNLRVPIDVRLIMPLALNKLNEEDYFNIISIPPLATVPLPITNSYFTSLQLRISGFSWSERNEISHADEPKLIECPNKAYRGSSVPDIQPAKKAKATESVVHRSAFASFKYSLLEFKDDTEKFFVKLYTFEPGLTVENYLCCPLEYQCIILNRREGMEFLETDIKTSGSLERGENFHWLEAPPYGSVGVALRIPGYDWSPMLNIFEEDKHIYQFSRRNMEQVNIFLESNKSDGTFRLLAYAQYWLENHTGLPLLFQYIEKDFSFDIMSLPYTVEGLHFEEYQEKKKIGSYETVLNAFGEKLDFEYEGVKPWLHYKEADKVGLGSLIEEEEDEEQKNMVNIRMFSADLDQPGSGTAAIRIANSEWSDLFRIVGNEPNKSLLTAGGHSILAVEKSKYHMNCMYEVAMSLQIAEEPFVKTKIIRFTPRFVLINKMPQVLLLTQFEPNIDFNGVCRLLPNERSSFHWPDCRRGRAICVKLEDYGWAWSGKFLIEEPDDFVVRVRNLHTHEEILMHITITLEESTLHVIFQDTSHSPPYRIENLSMETIEVNQSKTDFIKVLKPFEVTSYAWDERLLKKVLTVALHNQSQKSSVIIGKFKLDSPKDCEQIHLKSHGSHPSHPLFVDITTEGSTKVLTIRHNKSEEDYFSQSHLNYEKNDFILEINFSHFGISLINSTPQELIYATFKGLQFKLDQNNYDNIYELSLDSAQIDNQLYRVSNPVMLSPMENHEQQLLKIKVRKRQSTISNQEVDYFKYIKFSLQPVDIRIDGFIIEYLLNYASEISEVIGPLYKKENEVEKKVFHYYYFDKVLISSLTLNLTFSSIPSMFKNLNMINPIRMAFIIFANIGNVHLNFNSLKITHRHLTLDLLTRHISTFYYSEVKSKTLRILSSADVLGNPSEFVRNIRIGLIDLITLSGQPTFSGAMKGISSFFKHTLFGASNSASKCFDSIKKGIYAVYDDDKNNIGKGWKVAMAIARTALLVPNITISLASSTANHIRDAIQQQHPILRQRPPRSFLTSRLLTPYSYSDSVGQYVLSMVEQGKYLSEGIKFHLTLDSSVIVVTSRRVLSAIVEKSNAQWKVLLLSITMIKQTEKGLTIYYFGNTSPGFQQEKVEIKGQAAQLENLHKILTSLIR
ncbi:unnamed protein product [Blepharisma stoltei]|uniref:Vacuolar protein sorting-associated protein 13A n=1 Tax=Blepharisma stoltei TaxID=1481888 RepID=A0AAU9IT86_9CILI|nr:unnamed protein product [Blepharisma stoltei]